MKAFSLPQSTVILPPFDINRESGPKHTLGPWLMLVMLYRKGSFSQSVKFPMAVVLSLTLLVLRSCQANFVVASLVEDLVVITVDL